MTGRLLTAREVAEILGVSAETILRWHQKGTGPPAIRLPSGAFRFSPGALEAWLAERSTAVAETRGRFAPHPRRETNHAC